MVWSLNQAVQWCGPLNQAVQWCGPWIKPFNVVVPESSRSMLWSLNQDAQWCGPWIKPFNGLHGVLMVALTFAQVYRWDLGHFTRVVVGLTGRGRVTSFWPATVDISEVMVLVRSGPGWRQSRSPDYHVSLIVWGHSCCWLVTTGGASVAQTSLRIISGW